jgi:nucleotide-binding universal stress UspA family protein
MTIADLLVHVGRGRAAEATVDAAVQLAKAHGARLTLLALAAEPYLASAVGIHMPAELMHQLAAGAEADADRMLAEATTRVGGAVQVEGRRELAKVERLADMLVWHGRRADLVVISQPDPDDEDDYGMGFAEAAFMGCGRPTLIIPYIGVRGAMPPQRVLVAWDGSQEATRAIHDALPLLVKAERGASLVVVDPGRLSGRIGDQPGAGMAAHLARHGAKVEVATLHGEDLSVADVLLDRVSDDGADLIVMGAYGHARLRELVLGGTTRKILHHMTVPVLLSH